MINEVPSSAPAFSAWLDDFWRSYARHRPVNATFIGWHEHDDRLPDWSAAGVAAAHGDACALLERLAALPAEQLSPAQELDRKLARGFLRIQRWEYESSHFPGNPSLYTGEAAFGVLGLLRRPFAPLEQRLDHAAARMAAIPALLAQAQAALRSAPLAWTERALNECRGLHALLDGGLQQLLAEHSLERPDVLRAAAQAKSSLAEYERFLHRLRQQPSNGYACGEAAFALLLEQGHFLERSADDIAAYAEHAIAECESELQAGAREHGAVAPEDVLAGLNELHPAVDEYYARYGELWEACRAAADRHNLLSWPPYPIVYRPRPQWVRAAAADLYFLFYHAPAPFDALPETEYLVTPIDAAMPPDQQQRLLRATNDSVIKLNHVVHHGAVGHHVQNWHAYNRAASTVGRVAAVDCASRIALFCGGTMAEGWACYATDLMAEWGFLTPLERYAEHHGRLRMAARALVDVKLHTGHWTLDDAARFYRQRVGMAPAAAQSEATKNSMFPATALMYLLGTDQIHQLRRTLAGRPGFEFREFHDTLLGWGSVPVSLVAAAMAQDSVQA